MSVQSVAPELAGALGAVRAPAGRRPARFWPPLSKAPLLWLGPVAAGLVAGTWLVATLVHELLVLGVAWVLPALAGLPLFDALVAALPVNYVYATAMVRYAGQIAPSGLALTGPLGISLASARPGVFYDPAFVDGDGLASAVLAPGSSLLARALVIGLTDLMLLGAALGLAAWAARRAAGGPRALLDLRGGAALGMAVAVVAQAEVAARLLRAAGSTRDLESLGVLPFVFHQLLQLHTEVYDRWTFQLSRMLDPVFSEALLVVAYGLVASVWALGALVGGLRSGAVRSWLRRPGPARGWVDEPAEPVARTGPPARLVLDGALIAVLLAALPVVDGYASRSRFLDWEVGQPAAVAGAEAEVDETAPSPVSVEIVPVPGPGDGPVVLAGPAAAPGPSAQAAVGQDNPAVPDRARAAAPPSAGARAGRPSVVGIGGQGLSFSYVVNGEPSELRGMGYNVTHVGLPTAERAERLRRDFALMREVGVNTVFGWRTQEWDEAVLDAAHQAGVGVVMPFDLDDKLDYADRAVRSRLRTEILAWVARYRHHPALRMWGIGNETLLHLRQAGRARAFAEFYVGTVELVRQFDPDHPVLYREAEDVYVRWLQDSWKARGGPPAGFVLGMNFYTFRMKEAIAEWPKKGLDVPLVISEFAPAGVGRGDRPAGYWRMWSIVRSKPDLVLGAAPYVWSVDGPEPADRLFGLTDGNGQAVDTTLQTLKELYRVGSRVGGEGTAVVLPPLIGLKQSEAEAAVSGLGLRVAAVEHRQGWQMKDPRPHARYGVGSVLLQEPAAGTQLPRGGEVRLAVAAAPPQPDWPNGRPQPD
ncbi:MAG TPA: PASTA domain-containing protein [Chloroflexota bacterium]|nr:PASTA domain-containing protein [Chloroflexota bacterium]